MSSTEAEWVDATNGIIWTLRTEDNRAVQKKPANKYESKFQMIKEIKNRIAMSRTENRISMSRLDVQMWF